MRFGDADGPAGMKKGKTKRRVKRWVHCVGLMAESLGDHEVDGDAIENPRLEKRKKKNSAWPRANLLTRREHRTLERKLD